jgi:hypothetical protein
MIDIKCPSHFGFTERIKVIVKCPAFGFALCCVCVCMCVWRELKTF